MAAQKQVNPQVETVNLEEADFYRVFAFALGLPSLERFAWFDQPNFSQSLAKLLPTMYVSGAFAGEETFRDFEEYESTYIALFDVGIPEPPAPLVESAHFKAIPAQQTALENIQFYEVLGLQHDPRSYPPDHLVTQLEFLATVRFAQDQAKDQENQLSMLRLERDFLARHLLNWLPDLLKKLKREQSPVFSALLALLLTFLRGRSESLAIALVNRQD